MYHIYASPERFRSCPAVTDDDTLVDESLSIFLHPPPSPAAATDEDSASDIVQDDDDDDAVSWWCHSACASSLLISLTYYCGLNSSQFILSCWNMQPVYECFIAVSCFCAFRISTCILHFSAVKLKNGFYARQHICIAIARICYRPFVCPSITRVDHTKTVEVRTMKFSL